MNYESIKYITLEVYQKCNIHSFPINCLEILSCYQLDVRSYSSLSEELREYCLKYSNDALNFKNKICYNDMLPVGRINFSLMHELGHILMNHGENPSLKAEQEANYFASNILAPRMAIHYAGCKNQKDVVKIFQLTNEAAQYSFEAYRRWYRRTLLHKMNSFDKALYNHFYLEAHEKFIYHIHKCPYCNDMIYNSDEEICSKCKSSSDKRWINHEPDINFLIAESQWLYGGL